MTNAFTSPSPPLRSAILDKLAAEHDSEIVERIASDYLVERPAHYAAGDNDIECIDAMRAAFGSESVRIFCELNTFKYLWRMHQKSSSLHDKKKALWYLKFALSLEEGGAEADPRTVS